MISIFSVSVKKVGNYVSQLMAFSSHFPGEIFSSSLDCYFVYTIYFVEMSRRK